MDYYKLSKKEVLHNLNSSESGLTETEAKKRLKIYGKNEIKQLYKFNILKILISQFQNFIVYIMLAALLISLLLQHYIDSLIIGIIIILNIVLGFIQEYRAEKAVKKLEDLSSIYAIVIRNGKTKNIDSNDLVPGDIILLEQGAIVPADCYIIENIDLQADESILTGESTPVKKAIGILTEKPVAERINMLFSSTIITYGRGKAIITNTGMQTELGKIAHLIQEEKKDLTPLQKNLKKVGYFLSIAVITIAIIIFLVGLIRQESILQSLIISISLAVAAIPEGLPAVVTIGLALSVQRMIKRKVLVKKLASVEALGSVTVIATDKTGTLTKNKMTVEKIYTNKFIDVNGKKFTYKNKAVDKKELRAILETASLCNNAKLESSFGDPTELALLVAAKNANIMPNYKRIYEMPFTSEKKYMLTKNEINHKTITYIKGAPEVIIQLCNLSEKEADKIRKINNEMTNEALRVLAFASGHKKLKFHGLIGMIDPPRKEVKSSIALCKKAGIRVVMITGDHKLTAKAIASQIGISSDYILTGEELEKISKSKLKKLAEKVNIYTRVSPLHKVKILEALKENGEIVAMTGDGINDSPALKRSDIGVAVNSSTDVAKEASDIVLMDNHFSSIVNAVGEGRNVFDNIKKFINYLLSSNFGELLIIFIAMLIGFKVAGKTILPLTVIQILWINLVTDGLPALALSFDYGKKIMERPPRNPKQGIITFNMSLNILIIGLLMMISTLILFKQYLPDVIKAQTVAFTLVVLLEMVRVHMVRSQYKIKIFSNKWLIYAILASVSLQLIVIYTPLNKFFGTIPLYYEWIPIIITLIIVFIIGSISSIFIRKITKEID